MEASLINTYRALGLMNTAIANATNLDDALHECLRILVQNCGVVYATLWSASCDDDELAPTFWLGDTDITKLRHKAGDGAVGTAHQTQKSVRLLKFEDNPDPVTAADYPNVSVQTMVCVPFSSMTDDLGVLQLVNKDDGTCFSDEEADIIEMMAMICAMRLGRDQKLPPRWQQGRPLIEVRGVKREFVNGEVVTKVLKGVNLDVFEGEFLVLLGESGCGKSTLLNIVGGLDAPTEGSISFEGQDHVGATEHELTAFRRHNVGIIFQSYNLMKTLNARRNLSLISEIVDDPMSVDEALDLVGLSDRKDNLPSQMSGGQQQRVSIARALVKRPRLILADEPTAALDYQTSIEVLQALEKVMTTGTTMVMVTHNEEICRMANRVVRMRDGRMYEVTINRTIAPATDLVW